VSGAVVWLTGLPSSGKSTLARHVLARLRDRGVPAAVLDGDEVRDSLVPRPGYTPAERDAFYATLSRLAALLARQGLTVLVPATAHRRAWRTQARALAPQFIEVFVDVAADECRRRDAKGLYAQAARGSAADVPGAGVEYEPPGSAEVVARGGEDPAAAEQIVERLSQIVRSGPI
jgi:adenylylsulfate kinase